MAHVFEVHHWRDNPDGEDYIKFIGIFSTLDKAEAAVARHRRLPGFEDHPESFHVEKLRVDDDRGWAEGFVIIPYPDEK
jgi:hypothetical protein